MDIDDSKTDPDPRLDDLGDNSKMAVDDPKPKYKSWKKKYRKMRMRFDTKVYESEDLHKQELKGIEACKRIAIDNDRILDVLHDINSSEQIPLDKRIDISTLSSPEDNDSDDSATTQPLRPTKTLRNLLSTVSHLDYEEAVLAGLVDDIEFPSALPNADLEAKPPTFLTADDVDNYLFEIDNRIGGPVLPTLAPLAHHGHAATELGPDGAEATANANGTHGGPTSASINGFHHVLPGHHNQHHHTVPAIPASAPTSSSASYHLRNPASVYNWLRKHCPQVFLQDQEKDAPAAPVAKDDATTVTGTQHAASEKTTSKAGKSSGAASGKGAGSRSSKRASTKTTRAESMDMELDQQQQEEGTPAPAAKDAKATAGGKRKRVVDDDPGYRPKGGSSRPSRKRVRKSATSGSKDKDKDRDRDDGTAAAGDGEKTPTVKRSRKKKEKDVKSEAIVKDEVVDGEGETEIHAGDGGGEEADAPGDKE